MSSETTCYKCKEILSASTSRLLTVKDHRYHLLCWKCEECNKPFWDNEVVQEFYHKNNLAVCGECADKGTQCHGCNLIVSYREPQGKVLNALGKRWHHACFVCTNCQQPIKKLKYSKAHPDLPFCDKCPTTITPEITKRLESKKLIPQPKPVEKLVEKISEEKTSNSNKHNHSTVESKKIDENITPTPLQDSISLSSSSTSSPAPTTTTTTSNKPTCYGCNEIIETDALNLADHEWHSDCFKCNECFLTLDPSNFFNLGHRIVCSSCMVGTLL